MSDNLHKVEGGFNNVRFYEVYESPKARRKACKGAKRGQITGKAAEYMLVDFRPEYSADDTGNPTAVACLYPGPNTSDDPLYLGGVGYAYLNSMIVRRVGFKSVPKDWKEALMSAGWYVVKNGTLFEYHG